MKEIPRTATPNFTLGNDQRYQTIKVILIHVLAHNPPSPSHLYAALDRWGVGGRVGEGMKSELEVAIRIATRSAFALVLVTQHPPS